ncbi:acyl-CoA thioesterase [Kyrpidia spormannii]|uniref:Acyl-CoA thioesterase n=2 Tax=Kyrpidia spormannii TaxID=2055160 RepID=A0A2K8N9A2_9BACL|nr:MULTISPECIES: thioesterase family protein [Kyrpidia]HHY67129.1 acyl-CoA thioesterase [Alicyclobacillus sp.]ATY85387.1 acyl-CoA thioesterase [Kyrpidia spormannii]MCL6576698.1 acyl-CoA thioesterase [Kyrpidia sp.]CAB3393393.1 Acyl-CoA thioesterase [Kyrpidia spormannii]CAB3394314.1 Acyl-CoA thioesterase [Kyrpidia spormannii]
MAVISTVRVRYCETDAMGHVNNVSYLIYLEQGRTDFMREIRKDLGREVGIVLASIRCDFRAPCYFDDELQVRTEIQRVGKTSITMSQAILKGDQLVAEGESVIVHVDPVVQRPVPIPDDLRQVLMGQMAGEVNCS